MNPGLGRLRTLFAALLVPLAYTVFRLLIQRGWLQGLIWLQGSDDLAENRALLRFKDMLPLVHLVTALAFLVILHLLNRGRSPGLYAQIGLTRKLSLRRIPLLVLLGIGVNWLILLVLSRTLPPAWLASAAAESPGLWMLPYVLLAAPLTEEIVFRGCCYNRLRRICPPGAALLLQAVVFGLCHGTGVQFVYATLAGIALGWLYRKTRSLTAALVLHVAMNLGALLPLPVPGAVWLYILCLSAVLAANLWLLRRLNGKTNRNTAL